MQNKHEKRCPITYESAGIRQNRQKDSRMVFLLKQRKSVQLIATNLLLLANECNAKIQEAKMGFLVFF